jgi:hypothetical protein
MRREPSSTLISEDAQRALPLGTTVLVGRKYTPRVTFRSIVMEDGSPWKTLNEVDRPGTNYLLERHERADNLCYW